MADPCVLDTPSIHLDTTGSPAALEASVRNPASDFSATFGEDTKHDVNDTGVVHDSPIGGWPQSIDNSGGSLTMHGIVVVAINPIWVFATDPVTVVPFGRLTINGSVVDERDVNPTGIDLPAGTTQLLSLGSMLGQLGVPPGAAWDIDVMVTLENIGASGQWSFRFGGSKMVVSESF
jgi:hypothetical protein